MSGRAELARPEFVEFSLNAPIQTFNDPIEDVVWNFRQGGNGELEEAIVMIMGICETTNSAYLVSNGLIQSGFRVIILEIPAYNNIAQFLNGFDMITAHLRVSKLHLIGIGFGGFLAMYICSFKQLSAEIISLTVVCSFTKITIFKKNSFNYSKVSGKAKMVEELCESSIPSYLKPSVQFILKEIESLPIDTVMSRLRMRSTAPDAPLPTMDPQRIMVVHSTDWAFKLSQDEMPHKVMQGAKIALLKKGGNHPHLSSPSDLLAYLSVHLKRWHSAVAVEAPKPSEN